MKRELGLHINIHMHLVAAYAHKENIYANFGTRHINMRVFTHRLNVALTHEVDCEASMYKPDLKGAWLIIVYNAYNPECNHVWVKM